MTQIPCKINIRLPQASTLGVLAEKTGSKLLGDPDVVIQSVGTLENAKQGQITYLADLKYKKYLTQTEASAIILQESEENKINSIPLLISNDPKLTFTQVIQLLYPYQTLTCSQHPSAVIGEACDIHPLVYIGPHCVIGNRVKIGEGVVLQAGCIIGDDCEIKAGTFLYPRVTIYHDCTIGAECVIHAGAIIGSDGFGFVPTKGRWTKVPQLGGVRIGDRVEIGANTTIDRGAIEDTDIADDVILDNLIQIGHNVKIGNGTAIAACSGIAGSTTIGKYCMIGGGSKINGHIHIADQVQLVGGTHVAQSIDKAGAYASTTTASDIHVWKKNIVRFHQLNELATRLSEIEKKVEEKC
jgi:UDP-3-O-[3-hydroxymyristoyl] glucosamine N-acyltransferase